MKIISIIIISFLFLGTAHAQFADGFASGQASFVILDSAGTGIIPATSTWGLGNSSLPWSRLFFTNATGTSATTTNLATTWLCLDSCKNAWPSGSSFSFPFTKQSSGAQATSTVMEFVGGFMSDASSTLARFTATNSTTTGAVVAGDIGGVYLSAAGSGVGGIGFNSTPDGSYNAGVSGYGALFQLAPSTGVFNMYAESNVPAGVPHGHIISLGWDATGLVSTPVGITTNILLANGSSTFQNFTFQNATGTSATTTNLYVSGRASTTELRANTAYLGGVLNDGIGISGTNGQVLTSTGSATAWSSSLTKPLNATTTAVLAVQTLTVSVTYTDSSGTSRTQNFFGMGLTTAALSSLGDSNFPPMTIRPLKNTAIIVATTVTGVGSILYNIDASIIPISTQ